LFCSRGRLPAGRQGFTPPLVSCLQADRAPGHLYPEGENFSSDSQETQDVSFALFKSELMILEIGNFSNFFDNSSASLIPFFDNLISV